MNTITINEALESMKGKVRGLTSIETLIAFRNELIEDEYAIPKHDGSDGIMVFNLNEVKAWAKSVCLQMSGSFEHESIQYVLNGKVSSRHFYSIKDALVHAYKDNAK